MRVLIVDDEAPARARLARLLAAHADVELVGHACDGEEALAQVAALAPDVVMLDVQMPGIDGLDVAASLPDPAPALVFVTAHDRYALQSFEHAPLDYLLKPVDPQRLSRALDRARRRHDAGATRPGLQPRQLLVPDHRGLRLVRVSDIAWLEAADNYVALHVAGATTPAPLLRRPLADLLADLGPCFVRCHRSAAVALDHVVAVVAKDGGDASVQLRDGAAVRCSRTHRSELMQRLGQADGS